MDVSQKFEFNCSARPHAGFWSCLVDGRPHPIGSDMPHFLHLQVICGCRETRLLQRRDEHPHIRKFEQELKSHFNREDMRPAPSTLESYIALHPGLRKPLRLERGWELDTPDPSWRISLLACFWANCLLLSPIFTVATLNLTTLELTTRSSTRKTNAWLLEWLCLDCQTFKHSSQHGSRRRTCLVGALSRDDIAGKQCICRGSLLSSLFPRMKGLRNRLSSTVSSICPTSQRPSDCRRYLPPASTLVQRHDLRLQMERPPIIPNNQHLHERPPVVSTPLIRNEIKRPPSSPEPIMGLVLLEMASRSFKKSMSWGQG